MRVRHLQAGEGREGAPDAFSCPSGRLCVLLERYEPPVELPTHRRNRPAARKGFPDQVTWRGQHLRMDVLLNACPQIVRTIVVAIEMCVMLAAAAFVAYQSFRYVERIYALGAVSDIARVPTWVPHSAIFISFATIALIAAIRMAQKLRRQGAVKRAQSEPQS